MSELARTAPRSESSPVWSPTGDAIFYKGRALVRVPVDTEGGFTPGTPEVLFDVDWINDETGPHYDVSPDGERLLAVEMPGGPGNVGPNQFVVIQDWTTRLNAPTTAR